MKIPVGRSFTTNKRIDRPFDRAIGAMLQPKLTNVTSEGIDPILSFDSEFFFVARRIEHQGHLSTKFVSSLNQGFAILV